MIVSHIIIPFMLIGTMATGIKGEYREAVASWYGEYHFGRQTASGEIYNRKCLTFAHKTMEFGTEVEFYYKGKSVVAYCSDRGPFIKGREFDLSYQTAKQLEFFDVGIDEIKYKIIKEIEEDGQLWY